MAPCHQITSLLSLLQSHSKCTRSPSRCRRPLVLFHRTMTILTKMTILCPSSSQPSLCEVKPKCFQIFSIIANDQSCNYFNSEAAEYAASGRRRVDFLLLDGLRKRNQRCGQSIQNNGNCHRWQRENEDVETTVEVPTVH